ncbi:cysteine hydrolase family protein [Herbiconiux sp. VKM Ac-2851]|uniref:cysteine hydrolase family protein n=1 Tax=Herbiconiux sp. VKM Ac-2851 TaxID=2739025 RepID=UPI0015630132|nr:cysteine hydrolase [Herbiconiux sp. VKM Ac-2851]NQX33459.1 cysteine hydrolase [Herbiconiux sp. VKM Ac-2851]
MSGDEDVRGAGLRAAGHPVLVLVDVQRDFADPALLAEWGVDEAGLAAVDAAVTRCGELVDTARRLGVPVVWVELAYDPARPWRASAWLQTGSLDSPTDAFPCVAGSPGAEWWRLAPAPGEPQVPKRFYSGFAQTSLAGVLDELQAGWLVVAGLTTECCIQATATDAAQHDLPVVVARDATAAYDVALHEAALASMALNVADVRSVTDIERLWSAA